MNKKEKLFKLFFLYGLGIAIVFFPMLIRHSKYMFNPQAATYACQPFYAEHTVYGACVAFIIPSFLLMTSLKSESRITKNHFIIMFIAGLLIVAEVLSFSRAALLSLMVTAILFVIIKFKMRFVYFFILICLSVSAIYTVKDELFFSLKSNKSTSTSPDISSHYQSITNITTDVSNMERVNRWVCAFRMFEAKPTFGFGPGTYQFEYGKFQTPEYKTYISTNKGDKGNAHSEYLTYLSEAGIIGFINFLAIVTYSIILAIKMYRRETNDIIKKVILGALLGLITFYIHGFFNSFIDQDKMAVLVYSSLGLLTALDLNYKYQTISTKSE